MQRQEKIELLKSLIRIDSDDGNELAVAELLATVLRAHGVEAHLDPYGDHRANLVAEIGHCQTDRVLAFSGHMDTVGQGDKPWHHEPLGAEIVGDLLYGRGAADMKSGLAAMVVALIELKEEGRLPSGALRLLATAGEELGTTGSHRLERAGLVEDVDALVVGEPTADHVVFAHSGSYSYRINAVMGLVHFINEETRLFDDVAADPVLGTLEHSVTLFNGGRQVNVIPDLATLEGNVRPTAVFDNHQVDARLKTLVDRINENTPFQLSLEVLFSLQPVVTPQTVPLVKLALAAANANYPRGERKLKVIHGATDASVFTLHRPALPVVILGADQWDCAHQVDEFTTISGYLATIETYKQLATEFFKLSNGETLVGDN